MKELLIDYLKTEYPESEAKEQIKNAEITKLEACRVVYDNGVVEILIKDEFGDIRTPEELTYEVKMENIVAKD